MKIMAKFVEMFLMRNYFVIIFLPVLKCYKYDVLFDSQNEEHTDISELESYTGILYVE